MKPAIDHERTVAAKVALMARVDHDFTLHPPTSESVIYAMDLLRSEAKSFAMMIVEACPITREQSTALTLLEESLFFAIASLARNQEPPSDV